MGLPLADALAVLYVLYHEWMSGRDLLAALGMKEADLNRLDDHLSGSASAGRAQRQLQIASIGGEVG